MASKQQIAEELTSDAMTEILKKYDRVSLKIKRRNDKGQLATVHGSLLWYTANLPDLDQWLNNYSGGGRYTVYLFDPDNRSISAAPPYHITIDGAPKPPVHLGAKPTATPQASRGTTVQQVQDPNAPPPQPWARGLSQEDRAGWDREARRTMGSPAPGATVSSDQLAMSQVADLKAELAKLRAEHKATSLAAETENRRIKEQLEAERERAREDRHRAEMELLKQQIASASAVPKDQQAGIEKIAAALAPFAGVFSAMITAKESSAAKGLELQQQGLQGLMQATLQQASKPDPFQEMLRSLAGAAPAIIPLVQGFTQNVLEARSPKAQAELFNSMVESNFNTVALTAQLVEALAGGGEDEPKWLPVIRELLGGVMNMSEAYMKSPGGLPGQPPPPPRPVMAPPQTANLSGYTTIDAEGSDITQHPQNGAGAATPAPTQHPQLGLVLNALPPEFKTPEWQKIIVGLHTSPMPDNLADLITRHLEHLMSFDLLPPALADFTIDPHTALSRCLGPLPIAKNDPQALQVIHMTVINQLEEDGYLVFDRSESDVAEEEDGAAASPQASDDHPEPQAAAV